MQNEHFRTSCHSRVIYQFWKLFVFYIATEDSSSSSSSPVLEGSAGIAPENWVGSPTKTKDQNKKRDNKGAAGDYLRDFLEWLEKFTDNPEDTEVLAPAHINQGPDSERPTKVAPRKHSIDTHFSKDRNCEVCLRTKITRALCRRRTGEALLRAEKFCDMITADHKVLNEEGESRDNHWNTVVVQDLATQWIQSYPCKTKTSQETEKSLRQFLEPSHKPKVIYAESLDFGKSCEDLSWNH